MEEANAVKLIIDQNHKDKNVFEELDLHNCKLDQAWVILHAIIEEIKSWLLSGRLLYNKDGYYKIKIITGWGKHSKILGKSKIKMMVHSELKWMDIVMVEGGKKGGYVKAYFYK